VAEHYDILKFATPPEMRCSTCKSPTACVAPEALLSRLRALPNVQIDSGLRKFIKEMRERKPERPQPPKKPGASPARIGLFTLFTVVAIGAAGTLVWMQQRESQSKLASVEKELQKVTKPSATMPRPAWISSDTQGSAYCTEYVDRIACTGVSAYSRSRDTARLEAHNAALEELANTVGLKIKNKTFDEAVRPLFSGARADTLKALDVGRATPGTDGFMKLVGVVRKSRQTAAEALPLTGGSAAPTQQSDWYWEEYEVSGGGQKGTEFLVFVRFDLSPSALAALIEEYTTPVEVQGTKVITMFPGLAWVHPDVKQGALVLEARGSLRSRGVEARDIIVAVNGQPVRNSRDLAAKLESESKRPVLTVKRKDELKELGR
jgi:hypothetical protein